MKGLSLDLVHGNNYDNNRFISNIADFITSSTRAIPLEEEKKPEEKPAGKNDLKRKPIVLALRCHRLTSMRSPTLIRIP